MRRKSQSSVEFAMVVTIVGIVFSVFIIFFNSRIVDVQQEKNYAMLEDVGKIIKSEVDLASLVEDGYSRQFYLPAHLSNLDYIISYKNGSTLGTNYSFVVVEYADPEVSTGNYIFFVSPDVTGDFYKGKNNYIYKEDGVIDIDDEIPDVKASPNPVVMFVGDSIEVSITKGVQDENYKYTMLPGSSCTFPTSGRENTYGDGVVPVEGTYQGSCSFEVDQDSNLETLVVPVIVIEDFYFNVESTDGTSLVYDRQNYTVRVSPPMGFESSQLSVSVTEGFCELEEIPYPSPYSMEYYLVYYGPDSEPKSCTVTATLNEYEISKSKTVSFELDPILEIEPPSIYDAHPNQEYSFEVTTGALLNLEWSIKDILENDKCTLTVINNNKIEAKAGSGATDCLITVEHTASGVSAEATLSANPSIVMNIIAADGDKYLNVGDIESFKVEVDYLSVEADWSIEDPFYCAFTSQNLGVEEVRVIGLSEGECVLIAETDTNDADVILQTLDNIDSRYIIPVFDSDFDYVSIGELIQNPTSITQMEDDLCAEFGYNKIGEDRNWRLLIGSTSRNYVSEEWALKPNTPYINIYEQLIGVTKGDSLFPITTQDFYNPISTIDNYVVTGLNADGSMPFNCQSPDNIIGQGSPKAIDEAFIYTPDSEVSCDETAYYVYCVDQGP